MNLPGSLLCSMGWRRECGRSCFRRCLRIRKGTGRASSRARLSNGFWRTPCRCASDCNCISSSGTRRLKEFEVGEVNEVTEVKEAKEAREARDTETKERD